MRANLKERFGSGTLSIAVIVSPMLRTLQTATLALDWLVQRGVVFEASADWQGVYSLLRPLRPTFYPVPTSGAPRAAADPLPLGFLAPGPPCPHLGFDPVTAPSRLTLCPIENSTKPCDTGSPVASVSPLFPHVDFGRLDPVWPDKTSPQARRYAHSRAAILARGADALDAIRRRPEDIVFVVSHSGFLRSGVAGWWFFNADYRIFRFGASDAANPQQTLTPGTKLCQDDSTLAGGMGLSHTFPVELGSELPGEDEVPEEDLVV